MRPLIPGVILAGGLASRLGGGDKALLELAGITILDRIVAVLAPQCARLVLNANGDPSRFGGRLAVVADGIADRPGPLAGVLAGLDWAAMHEPDAQHVLTVPADTPFLPNDLVVRLHGRLAADHATIACARSAGRSHFTVALWPVALRDALRRSLTEAGVRRVGEFLDAHPVCYAEWPVDRFDPFLNVNTPADKARAEDIARRHAS